MSYGKDILESIKILIEHNDKDFFNALVSALPASRQETETKLVGYIVKEQRLTDAEKKAKADKLCQTVLSKLHLNDYAGAIITLQSELSKDGFAKIVSVGLLADGFGSDVFDKYDTDDLIWSGFKSLFTIDVTETAKEKRPSALSDYNIDIYLVHRRTGEKTLIDFGTLYQAKALYLWFLLHPRTELSKEDIEENFDDIFEIYRSLSGSRRDSDDADFDTFFKQSRPKANDAVYNALQNRDDAIWYEINLERMYKGGLFALSLPSEDIHLQDMIKKIRNTTTLKRKTATE